MPPLPLTSLRGGNYTFTGQESQSQSHIATDGQSVCLSVEPRLGLMTRYWLLSCPWEVALSDERTGLSFVRVSQQYCTNCHYVLRDQQTRCDAAEPS
jgi:hypothetical protein